MTTADRYKFTHGQGVYSNLLYQKLVHQNSIVLRMTICLHYDNIQDFLMICKYTQVSRLHSIFQHVNEILL